ncbi:MAG: hypothetical protein IKR99_02215 [Lachnospiraceae bacterium]|nr:hypothetical protein [Clostridiales bacterium]MBR6356953.1 hypothetical protein [Lachnospiraceae bacterium]
MDPKELHQEDMDRVAGGVRTNTWLNTVEDIEQTPIFEELKSRLTQYKRDNDLCNPDKLEECEKRLMTYIKFEAGYRIKRETVNEFVEKYLPLV